MPLIRAISYRDILEAPNAAALLDEYTAECSLPELGPTCPQSHLYEAMERSGGLQAFGVYDSRTLIGFANVLSWVVPHYGTKIASTESIFLAGEYRKRGIGAGMLDFVEQYAKDNACKAFQYTAPVGSRFAKMLAMNVGRYRRTNSVFLRSL
jgi:GNAT superfamily N-acetyltransferase